MDPKSKGQPKPAGEATKISERGGFLVRRLNQIWSGQLQRRFRDAGYNVTSVQFAALELIANCKGLDQTDLALRLGYDRATVGSMISRLERDAFVERISNPKDLRARLVTATQKGKAAARELSEIARQSDDDFLVRFTAQERDQIFALLRRLVEEGEHLDAAPEFRLEGRSAQEAREE